MANKNTERTNRNAQPKHPKKDRTFLFYKVTIILLFLFNKYFKCTLH